MDDHGDPSIGCHLAPERGEEWGQRAREHHVDDGASDRGDLPAQEADGWRTGNCRRSLRILAHTWRVHRNESASVRARRIPPHAARWPAVLSDFEQCRRLAA